MKITLVNKSKVRPSKKFIEKWLNFLGQELIHRKARQCKRLKGAELTVVFLEQRKARRLNRVFRKKDYATDILSFSGDDGSELGELVLCPSVLVRQAKEHELSFQQELAYLLTHGVLHLLGYDHEKSKREARIMMNLQDQIFAEGLDRFSKN